jgi:phosphatidylglycerophosphatase GEP4
MKLAMVQSINTKALLTLASVVRRPFLAAPHIHVPTISDVNYQSMRDHCGIKAVIFDKDNTLTAPYATEIHERAALGIKNALDVFGHDNVAILSNSAGTRDDKDYEDAIKIEAELGINVIRHDDKKPGGLKEVLQHFEENGIKDPSELCMVGDRLLTDIVFGNLYGMLTVHCLPLCSGSDNKSDNKVANIVRTAENKYMFRSLAGKWTRKRTIPHAIWEGEDKCPLILVDLDPNDPVYEMGATMKTEEEENSGNETDDVDHKANSSLN